MPGMNHYGSPMFIKTKEAFELGHNLANELEPSPFKCPHLTKHIQPHSIEKDEGTVSLDSDIDNYDVNQNIVDTAGLNDIVDLYDMDKEDAEEFDFFQMKMEKINRDLKHYLCVFCAEKETEWTDWFAIAQFSYNTKKQVSTKKTSFEVTQSYAP
ncbi:hypothetical protein F5I97DRAFT_1929175 [Phlebopus sp. FC_14]|nr:hypothetical protein F5I97DRAFT_1929175 [Phlebopus sp. FC_14]